MGKWKKRYRFQVNHQLNWAWATFLLNICLRRNMKTKEDSILRHKEPSLESRVTPRYKTKFGPNTTIRFQSKMTNKDWNQRAKLGYNSEINSWRYKTKAYCSSCQFDISVLQNLESKDWLIILIDWIEKTRRSEK